MGWDHRGWHTVCGQALGEQAIVEAACSGGGSVCVCVCVMNQSVCENLTTTVPQKTLPLAYAHAHTHARTHLPAPAAAHGGTLLKGAAAACVGVAAEDASLDVGVWRGHAVLIGDAGRVVGPRGLTGLVGGLSPWVQTLGRRMQQLRQMLRVYVCMYKR